MRELFEHADPVTGDALRVFGEDGRLHVEVVAEGGAAALVLVDRGAIRDLARALGEHFGTGARPAEVQH